MLFRRRGAPRGAVRGGAEGDIPREPLRPLPQEDTHPGAMLRVRDGKKAILLINFTMYHAALQLSSSS